MTPRKSKDERRAEVIEAALKLAAQVGPDRITAELIARELGVTQPAIFRHFPRKDDIWTATMDWLRGSLTGLWADAMADAPLAGRLEALIEAHLGFVDRHPAVPLVLLSPELQARHPAIGQAIGRMTGLFHGELARAVEDGMAAGALARDIEPGRAAWMVLTLVQGIALRWAASGRAFGIVDEGRALIRLAVRGLGVHSPGICPTNQDAACDAATSSVPASSNK